MFGSIFVSHFFETFSDLETGMVATAKVYDFWVGGIRLFVRWCLGAHMMINVFLVLGGIRRFVY